MPRGSKKTKAKKNKEVSPEIESPSNSPQNNKKNPIKKNAKTKKKSSKKGDGKIIVKNISNIKSKCSKKINVFVGVPTAVERETLKDGTERLVGVIGKGKDTFVVHNYDDLDSNERILENEQIVKVEYTNPNVKPIKNEAYNKGTISYKVNNPSIITMTPNEIRKHKDLDLTASITDIETFKEMDDGEVANLIVHVNSVDEVTYGSDDEAFTKTKLDIGDRSDALSFLTDHEGFESGDIVGLFNSYKRTRKQFTNIIGPYIMKPDILKKYYQRHIDELQEHIDDIVSLKPVFHPDDHAICTIRKFKQKQEEVKRKQKEIKELYKKLKIIVQIRQILNCNECTYVSSNQNYKKLNEKQMESMDDTDIICRWKVEIEFIEESSNHKLQLTAFDTNFAETFDLTANEFDDMEDEQKDEFLESLEGKECEVYIRNSYESREWKCKTYVSLQPRIVKIDLI